MMHKKRVGLEYITSRFYLTTCTGGTNMIKSTFGFALAAAALLLALSPEARRTTRKMVIKTMESALDLSEKTKEATMNMRKQMQSVVEEARN
jgi:hypothetical protein